MEKKSIKLIGICLIGAVISSGFLTQQAWSKGVTKNTTSIATPENLENFQFSEPAYTAEEIADTQAALAAEADDVEMQDLYENSFYESWNFTPVKLEDNDDVSIEIYQNAPSFKIKKGGRQQTLEFLVVKQNGKIRYAFAISAAAPNKLTPSNKTIGVPYFKVSHQAWRHMSTKYPSSGENNMDHVTYFYPSIGFHSTTFGAYATLGAAASHGCVRMGRPEARAVYSLIKANQATTQIYSYSATKAQDPLPSEIEIIKDLVAKDLNFIQYMLTTRNKGDVPFSESEYLEYKKQGVPLEKNDPLLRKMGVKELLEIRPEQDLGPGEKVIQPVTT